MHRVRSWLIIRDLLWEAAIIDTVEKDCVVTFSYFVTDETGAELERSDKDAPMVYLHGHQNILPALERALVGKSAGDQVSATLPPGDAYGERSETPPQRVPIKHLVAPTRKFKPGMIVRVNTNQGQRDVTIVKVGKFNVDVDTNHPYAGKTLTFNIDIESVREATPEELSHRHAHGIEGHDHH